MHKYCLKKKNTRMEGEKKESNKGPLKNDAIKVGERATQN